jgi:hypothetical protein
MLSDKHRGLITQPNSAVIARRCVTLDFVSIPNRTGEDRRLIAKAHFALIFGFRIARNFVAGTHEDRRLIAESDLARVQGCRVTDYSIATLDIYHGYLPSQPVID